MTAPASKIPDQSFINLVIGSLLALCLLLGVPFLFGLFGWSASPTEKSWGILVATGLAMIVKMFATESATGEFEFYKFGYDNCITSMGAIITAGAVQMYSRDDLFPGFANMTWLPVGAVKGAEARLQQLVLLFVVAWIATFITARICRGIKVHNVDPRGFRALLSALLGGGLLSAYSLLLAAKA